MARLLGVDIPNRKKIEYSLRYIYGIGPTRAKKILEETGIDPNRRTQELNEQELSLISNHIIEKVKWRSLVSISLPGVMPTIIKLDYRRHNSGQGYADQGPPFNLFYDMVADKTKFLLVQFLGSPIRINTRFLEYLFGASGSNAVNVTQRIFYLLAIWYINS